MSELRKDQQLRRTVLNCLLFEDTFYENGISISERIASLVPQVAPDTVASLAIEAREKFNLRHAPLWVVRQMAKHDTHKGLVAHTLNRVIKRADELAYFLYLYWVDPSTLEWEAAHSCERMALRYWNTSQESVFDEVEDTAHIKLIKQPLAGQVKKGLAHAFTKFEAYHLGKYKEEKGISLRDVMFLTHPSPKDDAQGEIWKKLVDKTLEAPDTWEVNLSAGANKKETFERLIKDGKLGSLAFLRNLRGMTEAGVDIDTINYGFENIKFDKILPYRFITAARYAPTLSEQLEKTMFRNLEAKERLSGLTVLLVDVSGSMDHPLTQKRFKRQRETNRIDVACGLALMLKEICERSHVATFSSNVVPINSELRGFALGENIRNSQIHAGTALSLALKKINASKYDRLIVITDEQNTDRTEAPKAKVDLSYVLNVAPEKEGISEKLGYKKIDGFSDAVIDYLIETEKEITGNWETLLDKMIVNLRGSVGVGF
jgi:hypothetical protein